MENQRFSCTGEASLHLVLNPFDAINGMTYSQVYEMTKDVCNKMFANPVIEEYSFHIERNDGKQWAPTDWFYFDGKKWVGRNGGKKPKIQV